MTPNQLEAACRAYVLFLALNPDDVVPSNGSPEFPDPNAVNQPRWMNYRAKIQAHERCLAAVVAGLTAPP